MDEPRPVLATFHAYDMDDVQSYAHLFDYIAALYDIEEQVRKWRKHGHTFKTADEVLDALHSFINEVRVQGNIYTP